MQARKNWLLIVCNSAGEGMFPTFYPNRTKDDMKKIIAKTVRTYKEEDSKAWEYGSTSIKNIETHYIIENNKEIMNSLYGYGVFSSYHIDVEAHIVENIPSK